MYNTEEELQLRIARNKKEVEAALKEASASFFMKFPDLYMGSWMGSEESQFLKIQQICNMMEKEKDKDKEEYEEKDYDLSFHIEALRNSVRYVELSVERLRRNFDFLVNYLKI